MLLLIGRCGGTGGGANEAGVGDIGDADIVPNLGGKGGAGGGRWCRSKVLVSTVSGEIIKVDGIIGPFFGTRFGWIGGGVVEVESLPVKDSSNEDFEDRGGKGGAI